MRVGRGIWGLTVLVAGLLAAAEPSFSQSLIQRMFNATGSRTPQHGYGRINPYGSGAQRYEYDWLPEDGGTYRTMCVRLCDGFYFPISFGVRRESFYRDNRACMKRCDGKARLFYYPSSGGSIEKMIDLSGRSYRTLPNAFRYRKSLVSGCSCRAAPWSAEAKARHLDYAAEEAERATEASPTKKRDVDPAVALYEERVLSRAPQSYRQRPPGFRRWQSRQAGYSGWSPRQWRHYD